jgi:hypothetical protein
MGGTCCKSTGSNWSSSPAKGELVDEAGKELFDKIKARYDEQVSPYYAASRLWTDYWSPDTANLDFYNWRPTTRLLKRNLI